jgi:hypothetical protein
MLRLWVGFTLLLVLLLPLFDPKKGFLLWLVLIVMYGLPVLLSKKTDKSDTEKQ